MSVSTAASAGEPATSEQILILLQQAEFVLPEPYLSEIISAYGYVRRLVARIHRGYRFDEEPAHVFNPLAFGRAAAAEVAK
ncbi:hypothetical protein [Achromobacter aloeverae]|nr:hypothetical protein [Achromobacter aloeverae]